jgi:hypothetical protein
MSTPIEQNPCRICDKPKAEHEEMRHQFVALDETRNTGLRPQKSSDDASSSSAPASQGSLGIARGGDPVLRLALIRAGVITPQDLDAIEAELKASGFANAAPQRVV